MFSPSAWTPQQFLMLIIKDKVLEISIRDGENLCMENPKAIIMAWNVLSVHHGYFRVVAFSIAQALIFIV
jgi:hypothetical protein